MNWRIEVDRDRCIGSGVCFGSAPRVFVLRDGVAEPISPDVGAEPTVLQVAENCPVEAITVTDAESGETLAPENQT